MLFAPDKVGSAVSSSDAQCLGPLSISRCRLEIKGQVQGVGFRPFVYRIARQRNLRGFVKNTADGVIIEHQGTIGDMLDFSQALMTEHPDAAIIRHLSSWIIPVVAEESEFRILDSDQGASATADVTPDLAVCPDCLAEMRQAGDGRHGYGLINCTNCGPRYSIVRQVPYDRPNTTMAGFALCPTCQQQYNDPGDRRFHAQPVACPACGPAIELADKQGNRIGGIDAAAQMLSAGSILAIKGLGGFHLACDAGNAPAVQRLRSLKKRDHKPFALMAATVELTE